MTVYFGNVSHKPSKSNPAGTRRFVEGTTDNPEFASIFGRSGRVNAVSSNAKLSVIDLYNAHSIFIDPQEMEQMSENQFLNQHTSMVSNFRALGRYMLKNRRPEMQVALSKLVPAATITAQGDAVIIAVAKKLIGLGSDKEVKEAASNQTTEQAFRETIYRELKSEQRNFSYNVHGIEINVLVRLTGARLVKSSHTVKTTFKIIDSQSQVVGSASTYTRKADNKYKKQMQGFSKLVRKLSNQIKTSNTLVKLEFGHRYDNHLSAVDNAARLRDASIGDFQEVQRGIQKLFDSIQPEDIGLNADDQFDDFNPASSIRRLWNDLGLASTDISMNINEFNRSLLQQYASGEMSGKEVFESAKDYFVPRFQTSLSNRFSAELIDTGALAEIMADEHTDDWRGVDHEEIVSLGQECIKQAAADYTELLKTTTDLNELLTLYRASNKAHEDQIIRIAVPILIQREGDSLADSRSDVAKTIDDQLSKQLLPIVNDAWDKWLDEHHITYTSSLNSHLNELFVDNVKEEYVNELLLKTNYSSNNDVTDVVKEFVDGQKNQITSWYDQNYDYDKGLATVKNQLLETLEHELPYRQVNDGYWKHIVNQLTDFNKATRYSLNGGIDSFIHKYAPDWEAYRTDDSNIHEEAQQALHSRMNMLLDKYLDDKGITRGLFIDVNGDVDALMGPAMDSNLSIIENLYPQVADKMTVKEFIDSNLKSDNAVAGFFDPGYQKVIDRIKTMFQTDKSNSHYHNYDPKVIFPAASAYGQGLITYDEYIEEVNPDIKLDTRTNIEADQVFNIKASDQMIKVLSSAMEETGVKTATFALVGKSPSHLVDLEMDSPFIKKLHNIALQEGNNVINEQMTPEWASKYFVEDIREGLNAIKLQAEQLLGTNPELKDAARHANVVLQLPEGSESQAAKYLERQLNDMDLVNRYFPQVAALLGDGSNQEKELSRTQFNKMLQKAISDQLIVAMEQDNVALGAYSQVGMNIPNLIDQVMTTSLPDDLYSEGRADIDSATALINSKITLNWTLDYFDGQLKKAHQEIIGKAEDKLRERSDAIQAFEATKTNLFITPQYISEASSYLAGSLTLYGLLSRIFPAVAKYMDTHPFDSRDEWRKDFDSIVFKSVVSSLMQVMDDTGLAWQAYDQVGKGPRSIAQSHIEDEFFDNLVDQVEECGSEAEAKSLIKSKLTSKWAATFFANDIAEGQDLINYDAENKLADNKEVAKAFNKANVDLLIPANNSVEAAQYLLNKLDLESFLRKVFPEVATIMNSQKSFNLDELKKQLKEKIRVSLNLALSDAHLDIKNKSEVGIRIGNLVNRVMNGSEFESLCNEAKDYSGDINAFLDNKITVQWAAQTFADDIAKGQENLLELAAQRLKSNSEIAEAFAASGRDIVVPKKMLFQAFLFINGTYTSKQLFNVINHDPDNKLPHMELNKEFKDQVEKAVIKALTTVMENTGISLKVYEMINLSVQSLADRKRDEPFVAELKREVDKKPGSRDAIINDKITPEWAEHLFKKDLALTHDFIQARVEDKLRNNPKLTKAFKNAGISFDYSIQYDTVAASYLENEISQDEFLKKVFPKVEANLLEDGKKDNQLLDRKVFDGQLRKAINDALEPVMEATGISFANFSFIGKGINVLVDRELNQDFANELFNEAQKQPDDIMSFLKTKITSEWASKHFDDDIDEAKIFIDQRAEEMLSENSKIKEAFYDTNTGLMIPRSHDMDAYNYFTHKIDQETFLRKVFPNVANEYYGENDFSKKLDRQKFNKQLQKAISTALYSAQEATGIAPSIYSSVDKGITDLASRDLSEDFANELFKQAQQQPENVEVLLKNTITSNWAAKHFAGDIDEAKTFIDQRAEEKLSDNPKVYEAFKEAGIDLLIPRKNDKQAAQFWSGNLSEENFIGLVFPNVAKILYENDTTQGMIGKENLFNIFEGGYYEVTSNIINDVLSSLHVTRDDYKKSTGHDIDDDLSRYSQKAAKELFDEVYYQADDYRKEMITDSARANVLGRHAAKVDKDNIKSAFRNTIADIANDQPGDITRSSVDRYVDKLLTERIEDILSEPAGMDDLVTMGAKRGWVSIKDDVESNDLDDILEYAKRKNIRYIDDLKDDIGLMFSDSFLKSRLKPCINEAVDTYADQICDIISNDVKDFNRNQSLVKVKEAVLQSPTDAIALVHGQLSAEDYVTKYRID